MRFEDCLYVSNVDFVRREILDKAYKYAYSIHPGATKMYQDLKQVYWWDGMKKDMVEYVAHCLTFQQVKAKHQKLVSLLQRLEVPE